MFGDRPEGIPTIGEVLFQFFACIEIENGYQRAPECVVYLNSDERRLSPSGSS